MQFVYHVQDLQQCQINIVENLMLNLDQIKAEKLTMFPQDLVIEKKQNAYEFLFEQQNQTSDMQKCNYDPLQNQDKPFHYSKNILKLLVKLKQYNIYIATLSQKSFLETGNPQQLTQEEILGNQGQTGQFILYNFGLENWKKVSEELMNSYCLSPELINAISNKCNLDNFELNEQMSVFNVGCIIFELFTRKKLCIYQIPNKSNLTKYIFLNGFSYEFYLIAQLVQKCVLDKEEETPLNRRLTLQEALDQMLYIDKCAQYINGAKNIKESIDLRQFFQFGSSLHEQLIQKLNYKASHQSTGRLFILQNLIKIKFIYLLFSKDQFSYFRNFLIMKFIIQELQQLQELNSVAYNPQIIKNTILNFKDSADEIKEFQQYYLKKYEILLYQLINGIYQTEHQIEDEQAKEYFETQFKENQVQDFQQDFHANLIEESTSQNKFQKLCLLNINSIFDYDKLMLNFKPIFLKYLMGQQQEIYDRLLEILFQQDPNEQLFCDLIQNFQQQVGLN